MKGALVRTIIEIHVGNIGLGDNSAVTAFM